MIGLRLLQKGRIDIPETTPARADLFLHPHQLRQIKPRLLEAKLIPPPLYFVAGIADPADPGKRPWNMEHVPDIPDHALFDTSCNLLVGNGRPLPGIIKLSPRRQHTPGEAYAF